MTEVPIIDLLIGTPAGAPPVAARMLAEDELALQQPLEAAHEGLESLLIMSLLFWGLVLIAAISAANWGADQLAVPFQKIRAQWGLSGAAGGALVAVITASPEVGINTAAAVRGASDIGLGNMLGANIVSIPLIIAIAYAATRWYVRHPPSHDQLYGANADRQRPTTLQLERSAITVQALPYLGIVALVAFLTLPAAWRGLQPLDGWIMLGAFGVFYLQAIVRDRIKGEPVAWLTREIVLSVAGIVTLSGGAYVAVLATENLVRILAISQLIGGLFISSTMSVAPEALKTWILVKVAQTTAATTSVIADNAVTMTLGFLPLAIMTTDISDFQLYWINLLFAGLFGMLFAVVTLVTQRSGGMHLWHVLPFIALYGTYIAIIMAIRL